MQRLNYYAVKKTVEFRLLTVFQHVADPTRVRTVADKNSTVTPLDLRPTVADQAFKGNSIEVQGQFNCTMNMPSTGCATSARARTSPFSSTGNTRRRLPYRRHADPYTALLRRFMKCRKACLHR